jgi:cytochrome c oxidase cbb3-type subunit 3
MRHALALGVPAVLLAVSVMAQGQQAQGPRPESFPAQQRPPADPALIERGRGLYSVTCSSCHGADARGGQLGGLNLLRSVLVLRDQEGELITPVVQQGRPGTAMVPIDLSAEDVRAIAAYLHSLQAASRGQGAPPPGPDLELDIIAGDPSAGAAYFEARCARCHSPTGDLQGIATRVPDARTLQNTWVAGRGARGGGRGGGAGRGGRGGSPVTATIHLPSGAMEGRLLRIDDFLVTIALEDGTIRSVARDGDRPRIEVRDPLDAHRELLGVYTNKAMRDVTAYLATLK